LRGLLELGVHGVQAPLVLIDGQPVFSKYNSIDFVVKGQLVEPATMRSTPEALIGIEHQPPPHQHLH
jgi:hypothetical protein